MAAMPDKGTSGGSSSSGGAAKFSVSADELKDVLECPVCLKVPRQPPIYQCERGHCICSVCHSKLTNCPVCRIPLGKTRSLIFEKVLQKMPHSCKFSDYGCKVEHTKSNLETHEKDCQFRLVNCVDLACQAQVCMAQLMTHMTKDHEREDFVHTESNTYRSHFIVQSSDFTREIMWISDHIVLEDRHFFRECCRSKDGQWFVWVYMIGSRKECEEYIYTVKIMSDDREEELMYRGRCVPLDVPKEKLVQVGNCLIFPDSTAKRFWANQRIHYQVYVANRKTKKSEKSSSSRSASSNLVTSTPQNSHLKDGGGGSSSPPSPQQQQPSDVAGSKTEQKATEPDSSTADSAAAASSASASAAAAKAAATEDSSSSSSKSSSSSSRNTSQNKKPSKDSDSTKDDERETSC